MGVAIAIIILLAIVVSAALVTTGRRRSRGSRAVAPPPPRPRPVPPKPPADPGFLIQKPADPGFTIVRRTAAPQVPRRSGSARHAVKNPVGDTDDFSVVSRAVNPTAICKLTGRKAGACTCDLHKPKK
jgi:hypothetical protein